MTIDEVKRQLFVNSDDVLGNDMVDLYEAQNCCDTSFSIGYNKAIDDFSERIKQLTYTSGTESDGYYKIHAICERDIDEIAEQLKAGDGECKN